MYEYLPGERFYNILKRSYEKYVLQKSRKSDIKMFAISFYMQNFESFLFWCYAKNEYVVDHPLFSFCNGFFSSRLWILSIQSPACMIWRFTKGAYTLKIFFNFICVPMKINQTEWDLKVLRIHNCYICIYIYNIIIY